MPTYSLTLRKDIGRRLTITEMDNNFLYLEDLSNDGLKLPAGYVYIGNNSNPATGSETFTFDLSNVNLKVGQGQSIIGDSMNDVLIGGQLNTILNSYGSSIIAGESNLIESDSNCSSIISGYGNTITCISKQSTIIGGCYNTTYYSCQSTIVGGAYNTICGIWDYCSTDFNSIIGGCSNVIYKSDYAAIIGGGSNCICDYDGDYSAIIAGLYNKINNQSQGGAIIGGYCNRLKYCAYYSSIIAGCYNVINGCYESTRFNTIVGGCCDSIFKGSCNSSIIGGASNSIVCSLNSVIIGGNNLHLMEESDVVYVPELKISSVDPGNGLTKLLVWDDNDTFKIKYRNVNTISGGGGGSASVIDVTYSELYDSILSKSLIPGSTYRLTDYQSYNFIHGYYNAYNNSPEQNVLPGRLFKEFTDTLNNNSIFFNGNIYAVGQYDGDLYIGGGFDELNEIERKYLMKLNADGTEDLTFYENLGSAFNSDVSAIAVQADGKILVGGQFDEFNNNTRKYLVRLNADGTEDTNFYLNLTDPGDNSGLDSWVKDIQIQSDGKILVGGYFSFLNGSQRLSLIRLNSDGTEDTSFYTNLVSTGDGSGLFGFVSTIAVDADGPIYLGGNFTSYNGTTLNRILKVDSTGLRDETFMINVGSGFSGDISKIDVQSEGKILVAGFFTVFNGVTRNRLVRLLSDGTEDEEFYTNLTSGGLTSSAFSGGIFTVNELPDSSIAVGGQFTQLNGEDTNYFVKLNNDGTRDYNFKSEGLFHQIFYVDQYSNTDYLLLAGEPLSYQDVELSKILMIYNVESPSGYNAREVHIGDTEVLLLKAISDHEFDRNVLSETYPSDELEYLPYCNNLGFELEITNNNTLPDETEVSGFDLQWDGDLLQVYFDMPSIYKIENGHYLIINAYFYPESSYYSIDVEFEPVTPHKSVPSWNGQYNNLVITEINITADGTRVYLPDLTYQNFLDYGADSLLVRTIEPVQEIKGWVTRRTNRDRNISIPFDFRSFKFRRYQMMLPYTDLDLYLEYYGFTDNDWGISGGVVTTGNYKDYYTLPPTGYYLYNFIIEGVGGPDGGYYNNGRVDNIVFRQDAYDCRIGNDCFYNTFFQDFSDNNIGHDFKYNIGTNNFTFNEIGDYFQNNIVKSFGYNKISSSFEDNRIGQNFASNTIGRNFYANEIYGYFESNDIGDYFNYNDLWSSFSYNKILINFTSNTIYNYFNYNTIGQAAYDNTIGSYNLIGEYDFNGNTIGNDMKGNLILGDFTSNVVLNEFYGNQFSDNCYRNRIGDFCWFNIIGTDFSDNQIGNWFSFNEPIGDGFQFNRIGNSFNNNNSIGDYFAYNVIGEHFEYNTIDDDFGFGGGNSRGNKIGNHFSGNTIGEYFYDNTVADMFQNNLVGKYFQMNDIKSVYLASQNFREYLGNILTITYSIGATGNDGLYTGIGTTAGSGLFGQFDIEVVGGYVSSVTVLNGGVQYQVGDILTVDNSIFGGPTDFEITVTTTSATPSIYEAYNTTIFKNGSGMNRLSYYDGDDVLVIKDIYA